MEIYEVIFYYFSDGQISAARNYINARCPTEASGLAFEMAKKRNSYHFNVSKERQ